MGMIPAIRAAMFEDVESRRPRRVFRVECGVCQLASRACPSFCGALLSAMAVGFSFPEGPAGPVCPAGHDANLMHKGVDESDD